MQKNNKVTAETMLGDQPLEKLVKQYKPRAEFLVVFYSTACGSLVCQKAQLFPEYKICREQTKQFERPDDALVINLDRD